MISKGKGIVLTGDLNVVHRDIDCFEIRGREIYSGATPKERANFGKLLNTFRELHPNERKYSWFSNRNKLSRMQYLGWRLDYFLVTSDLINRVIESKIWDEVVGSDHCPIELILQNNI